MNDLISKEWLIEAVEEGWIKLDTQEDYNRIIHLVRDIAPSAQPEQRWIPCGERLPESKPEDLEYPTVVICLSDGTVTLGCYYESTGQWGEGEDFNRLCMPVAWMPLPEPYKERREE